MAIQEIVDSFLPKFVSYGWLDIATVHNEESGIRIGLTRLNKKDDILRVDFLEITKYGMDDWQVEAFSDGDKILPHVACKLSYGEIDLIDWMILALKKEA